MRLRKFMFSEVLTKLPNLNLILALFNKVFFSTLRYTILLTLFTNTIICEIIFCAYDLNELMKKPS